MGTMLRWSEEQLAEHKAKQGKPVSTPAAKAPPAPAKPASTKAGLYALGRLKTGEMNPLEAKYAKYLEAERVAGRVLWFRFEGVKLRLADNTFLTPDFAVLAADGRLELRDVKGAKAVYQDDAKVKMRVAADAYPLVFKVIFPRPKKDGGGWIEEDV
jgi:hypothetical protein